MAVIGAIAVAVAVFVTAAVSVSVASATTVVVRQSLWLSLLQYSWFLLCRHR